jgi:hypothetical protein
VLAAAAATLTIGVLVGVLGRNRTPAPEPEPAVVHPPTPAEELRDLRAAVGSAEDREAVRRRVLDFRAKHPAGPHATAAAALLRKLPSPLDRLPVNGAPFVPASRTGSAVGTLAFTPDDSRLVVARTARPPEELTLPELSPTGRFIPTEVGGHAAAVTPDGRVAVGIDDAGRLVVWVGGGPRIVEVSGVSARLVAVTPDGKAAVVVPVDDGASLVRVDLATGRALARLDATADGVRDVHVTADGSGCVVFDETAVRVVPFAAGQPVRVIEPAAEVTGPPLGAVAPEGGRLYLAGIEPASGRYPSGADRSDVRYELPPDGRGFLWRGPRVPRASAMAVAADEAAVAVGTAGGRLVVFAAGTGKVTAEVTLPGGVRALAFSTSGRVVAAALDGGRVVLVPLGK